MNLKIRELTKTYPNGVKAIDNLNLEIEAGMFGLLGPNGAGKSSLMRTIATLQNADEGSIVFNGEDIFEDKMKFRSILGYLPQDFGVYPKVSAQKLLEYFAILKGVVSKKERNIIVEEVLDLTNLYEVRNKSVSGYSGGMRQRFGIAQLLLNKPKLIIVDEPTAGLDPAERNRFLNVLREIGSENIVIFSTHLVDDVKELCSNMAIMNNGKILSKSRTGIALESVENKIWTRRIDKEDLSSMKNTYQVLSSSFNEDNSLNIRVFSEALPSPEFERAKVTLEDVYFHTLNSQI